MKKVLSACSCLLLCVVLLASCQKADNRETASSTSSDSTSAVVDFVVTNDEEMFTERDGSADYDESTAVKIELDVTSAKTGSNSVKISGSTVTITEDGVYMITGALSDGMIIVDAPDTAKPQLVLNSVSITSSASAPLYIKEADKVFVTLIGESTLSAGDTFTAIDKNNIDAAVFSKQDLTFNGSGSLTVLSPAGHGIVCKDDLVFADGSYTIFSASHAIDANDSVRITDAVISATAGKDGIHVENSDDSTKGFVYISSGTLDITSEGDGISAGSYMQITDGTFDIVAGGGYENGTKESSDNWGGFRGNGGTSGKGGRASAGMSLDLTAEAELTSTTAIDDSSSSMKGLKSTGYMIISGGDFTINSADDAIHSNTSITINGGNFEIATGDDGIHADNALNVAAGEINISTSYEGLEALSLTVSGGNIKLVAKDDGLNAAGGTDQSGEGGRDGIFGGKPNIPISSSNGSILISGGTLYINASGDGIDANGTLEITGGHTTVVGPTQGDTATLDYDTSGKISGGTFIGTGALNMAQSFNICDQGVVAVSVGSQSAGTKIILSDSNGNEILTHTPELPYQVVILSSPDIESGQTYTLTVGTDKSEIKAN